MTTLRHAIKIAANQTAVFDALTDLDQMAQWHLGTVSGAMAEGQTLVLDPKPGQRFAWRTETLQAPTSVVQTAVEGSGTSPGRTLSFELAPAADGRTVVTLTDGTWADDDPHLAFCNTHWGEVLVRLKAHVESDRS